MRIYARGTPDYAPHAVRGLEEVITLLFLRRAIDVYRPEETADLALPQTGDIDMAVEGLTKVNSRHVV